MSFSSAVSRVASAVLSRLDDRDGAAVTWKFASGSTAELTGCIVEYTGADEILDDGRAVKTEGQIHVKKSDVPTFENTAKVTIDGVTFSIVRQLYSDASMSGFQISRDDRKVRAHGRTFRDAIS
jgi:hypothetical protein